MITFIVQKSSRTKCSHRLKYFDALIYLCLPTARARKRGKLFAVQIFSINALSLFGFSFITTGYPSERFVGYYIDYNMETCQKIFGFKRFQNVTFSLFFFPSSSCQINLINLLLIIQFLQST